MRNVFNSTSSTRYFSKDATKNYTYSMVFSAIKLPIIYIPFILSGFYVRLPDYPPIHGPRPRT